MKGFTLACFFLLVLLILGFLFTAFGAQTNWPAAKAPDKTLTRSVEIAGNKVHAKTEKGAKKETRTFPCMFDICGRSARARAAKQKQAK
jgi:hypothetical protein